MYRLDKELLGAEKLEVRTLGTPRHEIPVLKHL
jgi:hypothetical protein